jgi:hypothetical protein
VNWIERWQAISARIAGLIESGELLVRLYALQQANTGMVRRIMQELAQTHQELVLLLEDCESDMPPLAATALREYCRDPISPDAGSSGDAVELQPLVKLQLLRTRFNYLIRDSEIESRNATELAFEHLQRLIAVDLQVREKWIAAFKAGETSCEKLGSVHLLAHGIWAFKVKGGRAETDLVYGEAEPRLTSDARRRVARAMVLTEWKIVRDAERAGVKAREAREEAKEYTVGILGDLELKRTRYVVLVACRQQQLLSDVYENGVCYRHILLAVDPEVPSKSARRRR